MIRVIVAITDAQRAAHVGGPVEVSYKTFDIAAPELEAYMSNPKPNTFYERTIVGVEVLPRAEDDEQ